MSMFNKNAFEIISEASLTDNFMTNPVFDSDVDVEFSSLYDSIAEVPEAEVIYPAESIPVLKCSCKNPDRCEKDCCDEAASYFVELDMLEKFMESNQITDVAEAMQILANENDISLDEFAILIESEDVAREILEEAKKHKKATGNGKKITGVYTTANLLKGMKTKGIKVAKKSKKKCK